jgi:hypothetical protein
MGFPNVVNGSEEETLTATTTQGVPIGQKMVIEDGRIYRYCLNNSSTAIIVANLQQGAIPEVAKYGDQSVSNDHAAGALVIETIAATTTDMAADDLIDGYFWSEQPAQLGPAQRIKANTLITQGANTGTITPYTALAIALNGSADSDTISYIRNTWRNVIIAPASTETGLVAGVSVVVIAASGFGWLQTQGPCKVQTSGSPVITAHVISSGSAAGEITVQGAAADTVVGKFMHWATSNEDGLFWLTIE